MPRPNPHRPFTPDAQQMALRPAISGNDINGLGETSCRRPRVVYWAPNPDEIPHGAMQKWFYTVDTGLPIFAEIRVKRDAASRRALPPVARQPAQHSPAEWTMLLDQFVAQRALRTDWRR